MSNIETEIEQVAETMEKSTMSSKEVLFKTIRELGPEGIRAKLPLLEKSERELLVSTLEDMKKAVAMDKDYAAKFVQGKITDTIIQEDKADDDQDEKLVKPEAAKMNHQGTPTDGWEGQVIKGKEPMKEMKQIADKEAKKEVGEHEDEMHSAKKKIKSGKKDEMKEGLKEMKKALEAIHGGKATPELIKGEMKRMLAEESQDGDAPEMNEKTRANKENVEALNVAADNKAAQKKVNDEKQGMKKSINWAGENELLKAMTQGRNHTFSMEQYLDEVLKEAAGPAEPMAKSASGKEDLNDIIAKGQDTTWDALNCEKMIKANVANQRGKVVKSFEDDEIAQALGLTPEQAEKILGKK